MKTKDDEILKYDDEFCKFVYKYGLDEEYLHFRIKNLPEKKKSFFKNNCELPQNFFEYSFFNSDECRKELDLLSNNLEKIKGVPAYKIYEEKLDELNLIVNLLESCGKADFSMWSKRVYGRSNWFFALFARVLCRGNMLKRRTTSKFVSESELLSIFYSYMSSRGLTDWSVEISSEIVGNAMISKSEKKIYVRRRDSYAVSFVTGLLYHEVGVHVRRYVNGSKSLNIFSLGLGYYDSLEEGLATFFEFRKSFYLSSLYSAALKYLAVYYAEKYDLCTCYRMLSKYSSDTDSVFYYSLRAKRGTVGIGAYTKDLIYFSGFLKFLIMSPFYRIIGISWKDFMLFKFGFHHILKLRSLKSVYDKYINN